MSFGRNRRRSSNVARLIAVESVEPRVLLSGDEKFKAVLTGTGGTTIGEVKYEREDKDGEHKLEVKVWNAAMGLWEIRIDGKFAANFVTDEEGYGVFEFEHEGHDHGSSGAVNLPAPQAGMLINVNFVKNPSNPSIKGIPISGRLVSKDDDSRIAADLTASVTTAKREILETEYEAEQEGGQQKRRLELSVYNLQANTSYAVQIAGKGAGTITTNGIGQASLRYSDKPRAGYTAFPAGFPSVASGAAVTVGSALSSTFSAGTGTRAPLSQSGVHQKVALSSATAASGFVSWEVWTPTGATAPKRQFRIEVWNLPAGSKHAVTVGKVSVGTVTANAKGFARLTFEDGDAEKAFPKNWPGIVDNTVVSVGNSIAGAFPMTVPTLAPLEQNVREAYELDQTLALTALSTLYENSGGKGEKWLKGRSKDWYFITPDGSLYKWDGKAGANGARVAVLDDAFFVKPELLTEAKAARDSSISDDLVKASAARLDRSLELNSAAASNNNWGGLGEKWFRGKGNEWYFITPDGTLTRWDKSPKATGKVVARLDGRYHEKPELLTEAETQLPQAEREYAAKTSLKLAEFRPDTTGWLFNGAEVRWYRGFDNRWYFLTNTGDYYLWNGSKSAAGTRITSFNDLYNLPYRLMNATSGADADARLVLDQLYASAANFL